MTETERKWSERVAEWKASGRTAREFAVGRDFKASTLVYWASVLRGGPRGRAALQGERPRRVRMVRVVRSTRQPEDAIVVTVGAARVAVRAGFNDELLRQVVKALGDGR